MNKKNQLITYISNFVPELGFLTDQQDKFIPITHPSAEIAAQRLLNHEEGEYLSGYIKITYEDKVILSEKEWTGELLETWSDLSYIVSDGASEEKYHIELLDNPDKLYLVRKENGYFFEINKLALNENPEVIQSSVVPASELLEAIFSGYQEFIKFCTEKNLPFSEESLLHSSIESLKDLENKKA
ncbi:hypothetical protein [Pseudobacillus wudalianchiensis]|uniref:Uncharacterized protein n=1 Tax=Pseudobacillus wudalianchiensis TaxID=1743143 RepID=A0A1B9AYL4_9BACI|nr:hypothetical protein [Bacillus wudalianchiensis]OCA89055.1 hypothetical protein A8F95_06500 [Bacillus wudalianchiensis]